MYVLTAALTVLGIWIAVTAVILATEVGGTWLVKRYGRQLSRVRERWFALTDRASGYFYPGYVDSTKVRAGDGWAKFVRVDGRTYRKQYDEYGSCGRTRVSLLPWGKVFYRDAVDSLK